MMIVASPRVRAKQKKNTNYLLSSVVYKLTVVGQIFWKHSMSWTLVQFHK